MKKYEVGFIIRPNLEETQLKDLVSKLKAIYTDANCDIIDELDLGVRELAYEIQKHKSGYYFFFVATANGEVNKEFERICRISEDVIRFMVVNVEGISGSTLDTLRK